MKNILFARGTGLAIRLVPLLAWITFPIYAISSSCDLSQEEESRGLSTDLHEVSFSEPLAQVLELLSKVGSVNINLDGTLNPKQPIHLYIPGPKTIHEILDDISFLYGFEIQENEDLVVLLPRSKPKPGKTEIPPATQEDVFESGLNTKVDRFSFSNESLSDVIELLGKAANAHIATASGVPNIRINYNLATEKTVKKVLEEIAMLYHLDLVFRPKLTAFFPTRRTPKSNVSQSPMQPAGRELFPSMNRETKLDRDIDEFFGRDLKVELELKRPDLIPASDPETSSGR